MFKGYLEFGSAGELCNIERTEAYVGNLFPSLPFKPVGTLGTLHIAGGDTPYRSPLLDGAPWANANDPITDAFYGLYPLDIAGIGDSTYAASSTESTQAGGSVQGGRSSSRDVKLSGLLIGANELAAEAGLNWLRHALEASDCADQCGGSSLRYFLAEPAVCEHLWSPENGSSNSQNFGTISTGGRATIRWPGDPTMPSRSIWTGAFVEGTEVLFGAQTLLGEILAADDILPLRRNYALNPTFLSGLGLWTTSGSPTWKYSGGTDGGGYANLPAPTGAVLPYGAGNYGAGNYGAALAQVISPVLATPAGTVTASVALRNGTALVQLVDASTGYVVASTTVSAGTSWQRFSVTGATSTSRLVVAGITAVDVDDALVESSPTANDYFDGSDERDGYTTVWLGTPQASTSERRYVLDLETAWGDSDFVPFLQVVNGAVSALRLTWFLRDPISVDAQLRPYDRTMHNVAVTQGAQVIQRVDNTDSTGGYFIQVEVIFSAGNPFSYAPPALVSTLPSLSLPYSDPAVVAPLTDDWLFDPAALVPSAPPAAPDIVADAIDSTITSWQRFYVPVPASAVADWASSVPLLQLDSLASAIRQVRVRFHPNPFGYAPEQVDPLSYCADFLISYLPAHTSLLMNGMVQSASATKAGVATVPADSILYGSDGGPMTWPKLSCGIPYVMTVDVPSPADWSLFYLSLSMAREE